MGIVGEIGECSRDSGIEDNHDRRVSLEKAEA
jgi:hypothetical protein